MCASIAGYVDNTFCKFIPCPNPSSTEQLVEDLFINSGYNVYNHGLERLLPGLSNIIRHRKGATGTSLRFMPDFVVQSSQSGDLFYMEVKYRRNGRFSIEELHENYPTPTHGL